MIIKEPMFAWINKEKGKFCFVIPTDDYWDRQYAFRYALGYKFGKTAISLYVLEEGIVLKPLSLEEAAFFVGALHASVQDAHAHYLPSWKITQFYNALLGVLNA